MTEFHKEELDLLESFIQGTVHHLSARKSLVLRQSHEAEEQHVIDQCSQEISDIDRTVHAAEKALVFIREHLRELTITPEPKEVK